MDDIGLYEPLSTDETEDLLPEYKVQHSTFSEFLWNFSSKKMKMNVILFWMMTYLAARERFIPVTLKDLEICFWQILTRTQNDKTS